MTGACDLLDEGSQVLYRALRVIYRQSQNCEALGCTNPGGAFTSERDGEVYEFCSEACRAAFERPAA